MEDFDLLLGIVKEAGTALRGRTTLQKLAYFASVKGLGQFKFSPHYYGPYSKGVTSAADLLVGFDLLEERAEILGERADPWLQEIGGEMKAYTYSLTSEGDKFVEESKGKNLRDWAGLGVLVHDCREESGLSPSILASAAKIHYLLSSGNIAQVTPDSVSEAASKFGWRLSAADIGKTEALLTRLGFGTK